MSGYMGYSNSIGECGEIITTELYGDFMEVRCGCGRSMTCSDGGYSEELCFDCERNNL